jgi:hypothetical protein
VPEPADDGDIIRFCARFAERIGPARSGWNQLQMRPPVIAGENIG